MEKEFLKKLFEDHQSVESFPTSQQVCDFTTKVLQTLFPALSPRKYELLEALEEEYVNMESNLIAILTLIKDRLEKKPEDLAHLFFKSLPSIYSKLKSDIIAIVNGDPAAVSEFEVIRTYPGFYAIAMFRIAHELYLLNIPTIPRIITEFAHARTGIDIHPGASIGSFFCIDHGTGIVIGETTLIGDNVKIYQGVTLGALSVNKSMAMQKRHPTIEDFVIIYSNATILGGNTIIGRNSVIGGNVWVTKSVPPSSTVYHKPQTVFSKTEFKSDTQEL